ncbi:hypothetical protein HJC23_003693 [Cyclotella cryptica]|uniref:Sulfotransferase domain-containing protein n=1 Tax=Cyclotella cryptica TaxID=29204 RepID=A0ABD3QUR1_9STRA|eukprot:CCRYP_002078-RA/>CCRYP_002078-RA protein AED:0.34 eAED:0.34 QI:0/-1/0/1/-1/1/1/0/331
MRPDIHMQNKGVENLNATIHNLTNIYSNHSTQGLRSRCQIVYILGVEGASHHGFTPVLDALAREQVDSTGKPFKIHLQPHALRSALKGHFGKAAPLNNSSLIHDRLSSLCPNDGHQHVIIEDCSFPCGFVDRPCGYYPRQYEWRNMTMQGIAQSDAAINHPVNLYQFLELYGPHARIKFVVLHRPYLDTLASHVTWDGGWEGHSNVIRGFMMLLRRFLDQHQVDSLSGEKLWTLVCVERLTAKFYGYEGEEETRAKLEVARHRILFYLAEFLGWPQGECLHCFDSWRDGSTDKLQVFSSVKVFSLLDHMREIRGVWPPRISGSLPEQQCST